MPEQMYKVTITASGTVHDKDGNIVSETPIEATTVLTEDEVKALTQPIEPNTGLPS